MISQNPSSNTCDLYKGCAQFDYQPGCLQSRLSLCVFPQFLQACIRLIPLLMSFINHLAIQHYIIGVTNNIIHQPPRGNNMIINCIQSRKELQPIDLHMLATRIIKCSPHRKARCGAHSFFFWLSYSV
jgi:hypothetical protein